MGLRVLTSLPDLFRNRHVLCYADVETSQSIREIIMSSQKVELNVSYIYIRFNLLSYRVSSSIVVIPVDSTSSLRLYAINGLAAGIFNMQSGDVLEHNCSSRISGKSYPRWQKESTPKVNHARSGQPKIIALSKSDQSIHLRCC